MWQLKDFVQWFMEFIQDKRIVVESKTTEGYNPTGAAPSSHTTTKKYYIENK